MQVGRRIAKLRATHGESLREAAVRTGVSHTTIARIEKGETVGSFHTTLRKIAEGYGVRVEFLLTGRDPRQDFERSVRRLPPEERNRLYFTSAQTRTRMVLDFLQLEYPDEFSLRGLTHLLDSEMPELGLDPNDWISGEWSDEATLRLAEALSRVTGISPHWFQSGSLGGEVVEIIPKESATAYVNLMKKAAQAGIEPHMLEMAIDLLIIKQHQRLPS